MPADRAKEALSLADFVTLFEALAEEGIPAIVIGGCAVGAYGRLLRETIVSGDLDLLTDHRALHRVLDHVHARGARIRKRPVPRRLEVAVFDWEGKEVNLLTASAGLPSPEVEARVAREFHLPDRPALPILVADPFDLLANKLALDRPKDRPHIDVLLRFIEEEAVAAFESEVDPRRRIAPADRLLRVRRARNLDEALAARLIPLARVPADFKFLMNHVPTHELADALEARATGDSLRQELRAIRQRRRLAHRR